jgi:hypothetical protein
MDEITVKLNEIVTATIDPVLRSARFRRRGFKWVYVDRTLEQAVVLVRYSADPGIIFFSIDLESRNLGAMEVNDILLGDERYRGLRIGELLTPARTIWWRVSGRGLELGLPGTSDAEPDDGALERLVSSALIPKIMAIRNHWVFSISDGAGAPARLESLEIKQCSIVKISGNQLRIYFDDEIPIQYPEIVEGLIEVLLTLPGVLSVRRSEREQLELRISNGIAYGSLSQLTKYVDDYVDGELRKIEGDR